VKDALLPNDKTCLGFVKKTIILLLYHHKKVFHDMFKYHVTY